MHRSSRAPLKKPYASRLHCFYSRRGRGRVTSGGLTVAPCRQKSDYWGPNAFAISISQKATDDRSPNAFAIEFPCAFPVIIINFDSTSR